MFTTGREDERRRVGELGIESSCEDARDLVREERDEEREEIRSETAVRVEDGELRVAVESRTVVVDEVVQAISMAMGVSKREVIGLTAATLVVVAAVAAGVMAVELEA